jgi:hypothetical protein
MHDRPRELCEDESMATRAIVAVLLPVVLCAQAPVEKRRSAKDTVGLIIWGGGKAPADAETAKADFLAKKPERLQGPAPIIIKSDDVPGLNKGFHVVVIGACAPARGGTLVSGLRDVSAGVYQRRVPKSTLPKDLAKLACPTWKKLSFAQRAKAFVDAGVPTDAEPMGSIEVSKGVSLLVFERTQSSTTEEDGVEMTSDSTTTTYWVWNKPAGPVVVMERVSTKNSSDVECDRTMESSDPEFAPSKSGMPDVTFVVTEKDTCADINWDGDPDFKPKGPTETRERWTFNGARYSR